MTDFLFYHLERASLVDVLPTLLARSLERGWQCAVRCADDAARARLDDLLWTYDDQSFLPHGSDGDPSDHPVWLTSGQDIPGDRQIVFLTGGTVLAPDAAAGLERSVVLFDGNDETALTAARTLWKEVAASAAVDGTYWRQGTGGRWEKQG